MTITSVTTKPHPIVAPQSTTQTRQVQQPTKDSDGDNDGDTGSAALKPESAEGKLATTGTLGTQVNSRA